MLPQTSPAGERAALLRSFSRELAKTGGLLAPDYLGFGLNLAETRCLYEIGYADGLGVSALAERCGLDLGYTSRVASRLLGRGLVVKAVAADRRSRLLALTAPGRACLAELEARSDQRLAAWLGERPCSQVTPLLDGLRAFLQRPADGVELTDPLPGDIGRVIQRHAELYVSEFGYPASFERYVVQAFAAFLDDLAPPFDRLIIARRGGDLVGSVAVKRADGGLAQLRFLLIEPAARGHGLGRRLVGAAVEHARAVGAPGMVLETASNLAAARAIYAAAGFVQVREQAAEWLPAGITSETWTLRLTPGIA